MTDFMGYILQGLFTGIGVGIANYLHETHIKKKLTSIEDNLKKLRNGGF